jgi:hypothetical protein
MTIATVESEADLRHPGRVAYRITGSNAVAVQDAIDVITRPIDKLGGFSNFIGPCRIDGGYGALGEVIFETQEVK